MDIYLIRHGETDWNKEKKLQGVTDIPLNAYGIELAEKTAEGLKDVPFDRIYTSPLIRAKKTAEIIRGNRPIDLVVKEELKETVLAITKAIIINRRLMISRFLDSASFLRILPTTRRRPMERASVI